MIEDVTATAEGHLQYLGRATSPEKRAHQVFTTTGCGCQLVKGGPCSSQFCVQHYNSIQACCAELTWYELTVMS